MEVKICICLSHRLLQDKKLSFDSYSRIKKSAEIFHNHNCNFLITTGWAYHEDLEFSLANYMSLEANNRFDIPLEKIIKEERCKDTVGEAIFTKQLIFREFPLHRIKLFIVTSDWHFDRAKEIFDSIYVEELISLSYEQVKGSDYERTQERKKSSINEFRDMMSECRSREINELLDIIYKKHKLYRKVN